MNSIIVSITWNTGISLSDILIYIGTILIGFELVRKIQRFELMLILIAAWPLSPIINAFPTTEQQRARFKWNKIFRSHSLVKVLYAILFLLLLSPVSVLSFLAYVCTELINAIEKLLGILYWRLITKYEKFSKKLVGILIQRTKRYRGLSSNAVVLQMKNEKIPFLPVIGIIVLIIGVLIKVF